MNWRKTCGQGLPAALIGLGRATGSKDISDVIWLRIPRTLVLALAIATLTAAGPALADYQRYSASESVREQANALEVLTRELKRTSAVDAITKLRLKARLDAIVSELSETSDAKTLSRLQGRFDHLVSETARLLRPEAPGLSAKLMRLRPRIWTTLVAELPQNRGQRIAQGRP